MSFPSHDRAQKIWAKDVQDKIDKALNPLILGHYTKSSMRQLSREETNYADEIKFITLLNLSDFYGQSVDDDNIIQASQNSVDSNILNLFKQEVQDLSIELDRGLTLAEQKDLICDLFANHCVNINGE